MTITDEITQCSQQSVCSECGITFQEDFPAVMLQFFAPPRMCGECLDKQFVADEIAETERSRKEAIKSLEESWDAICPPLYRDTDRRHPGLSRAVLSALREWDWRSGYGIGLVGLSARGKTRLAYLKLRTIHMAGESVYAITSKDLEKSAQNYFSDDQTEKRESRDNLRRCQKATFLLIDDLGKEKYSATVAGNLFDLIDHRTKHILPTIWTCNSTLDALASNLGDIYGGPLLRRLQEFTHVVNADATAPGKLTDKPPLKCSLKTSQ